MIAYRRLISKPWTGCRTNLPIIQELNVQAKKLFLITIQILKFLGHDIKIDGLKNIIIQGKVKRRKNKGRTVFGI